ncbi:MAG: hypothetical protein LBT08_01775 [Synergistaceae bacterium]|jgi:chromosome segregation ATPase|nr:hypothetical protein [Synergistaceae bacterium]
MFAKISELEEIVGKLETLVKSLAKERDQATEEASRMKKALDEREFELLQLDEELQRETKRFQEERASMELEQEETGRKLDDLASRIRALLPLLPESNSEETGERY